MTESRYRVAPAIGTDLPSDELTSVHQRLVKSLHVRLAGLSCVGGECSRSEMKKALNGYILYEICKRFQTGTRDGPAVLSVVMLFNHEEDRLLILAWL
jgi:hypothetical protein